MYADHSTATERPGVQEQYETAGNASNLAVEAEKRTPADVLIAAGWSPSRLGLALLRLHSEWSSAAKPKRATAEAVEALTAQIKRDDAKAQEVAMALRKPYTHPGPAAARARAEADRWFTNELRLLALSLKSRAQVWDGLAPWAEGRGHSPEVVAAALLHWLHPACPACDGLGLRKVPNAPALSARQCSKCGGSGHRPHPEGAGRVLGHMDYCVSVARASMTQRLRGARNG